MKNNEHLLSLKSLLEYQTISVIPELISREPSVERDRRTAFNSRLAGTPSFPIVDPSHVLTRAASLTVEDSLGAVNVRSTVLFLVPLLDPPWKGAEVLSAGTGLICLTLALPYTVPNVLTLLGLLFVGTQTLFTLALVSKSSVAMLVFTIKIV